MNFIKFIISILLLFFILMIGVETFHVYKKLPEGLNFAGKKYISSSVKFLRDITYYKDSKRYVDQQIFDEVISLIHGAKKLIVIDMFLFNSMQIVTVENQRKISSELANSLINKKNNIPSIQIIVTTDLINTIYGGLESELFNKLSDAGIDVVYTNLLKLRDSNPVYSAFWRTIIRPLENFITLEINNPLGDGKIPLVSMLSLINFKANHRKVIIADRNGELYGLVTSANPHDASSAHGNIGIIFNGKAALDLLHTEKAVLEFSNGPSIKFTGNVSKRKSNIDVAVITELQIKNTILNNLESLGQGDALDVVMFYLSDRDIISSLIKSYQRGVFVRIILDPNKDAFGIEKDGVPNRQVAGELTSHRIKVKWANTHGEQLHSKMMLIKKKDGNAVLIAGSSNYTRRNFQYNLETNLVVRAVVDSSVMNDSGLYFDTLWNNKNNIKHTVPFDEYKDNSLYRVIKYRFMEFSGISTF